MHLIHGPNIPGSYAILLFTASDFTSITSHVQNWVLFLFWLCLFILSGIISPLFTSSILGTYRPGEFIFQCPIFLPFHAVHGVLKARILKWFAIPFSSRPRFVRTLHHDHLGWPYPKWPGVSNQPENEGHVPLWSLGPSYMLSPRDHNQDPSGLMRPIFWFPGWTRLRITQSSSVGNASSSPAHHSHPICSPLHLPAVSSKAETTILWMTHLHIL